MTLQTGYVPGLAAFDGSNPATATWRFGLEDHLGSPRAYLGQSKAAMARYDFSPYGELMRSAGLPLTVGYTGHLWDPALRQYFAPFRHFNPKTARWNMPDPLGMVDGPNVYAYVAGNPVNYSDGLGLQGSAIACALKIGPSLPPVIAAAGAALSTTVGIFTAPVSVPVIIAGVVIAAGAGVAIGVYISRDTEDTEDIGHTKNPSPSKWNKHTKPRPGRENTKNRKKPGWKPRVPDRPQDMPPKNGGPKCK